MSWLGLAICLVISFVFSGIEAGILSVNRVRLRHRVKLRDAAAIKLQRLLARPERLLVTILLVTNFMNICAMILAAEEFVGLLGKIGYALAGLVALPVYLFGLELLPKSLFRRFPYRALAALSEPLRITDLLLSPVLAAGAALRRLFIAPRETEPRKLFAAREDFKYLTIESELQGTLGKVEREMIHNVVDFSKVLARDVMLPMEKVHTARADLALPALLESSRRHDIDRFPILDPRGEIIGLVNVFEVLVDHTAHEKVSAYQRRIVSVAAAEEAYQVIRKLRAARSTLAAVVREDRQPLGVVSEEDLIGRLVKTATAGDNV